MAMQFIETGGGDNLMITATRLANSNCEAERSSIYRSLYFEMFQVAFAFLFLDTIA